MKLRKLVIGLVSFLVITSIMTWLVYSTLQRSVTGPTTGYAAEFTDVFHPDMLGLTGSEEQVRAASQAFRTYFRIQDPNDEFYLVDHSTFTYFMMPGQGFVDLVRRDETADEVAPRLQCIIEHFEAGGAKPAGM